ncbi:MAG TPA: peptidylprolyl isomerase [Thermohalobaculum sp.]|nr:peptidylprolyl isomerase [Thermohalobaculum sp.]
MFRSIAAHLAGLLAVTLALATPEAKAVDIKDPENTLIIELEPGRVVIEMLPDVAPEHVARIKELARAGAYDGVAFHRVIEGFMAQTGDVQHGDMDEGYDPRRAGTGGSDLPDLPAEFSDQPFERGTTGMARSQDPNSANSQFFIVFASAPHLNGQYTVWGRVIEGMEHVDAIKRGAGQSGSVSDPDRMLRVYVAADR